MTFKEFVKDIDAIAQSEFKTIMNAVVAVSESVMQIKFELKIPVELMSKYSLNSDITLVVNAQPNDAQIEYLYKGVVICPECYYIRPTPYHPVDTLTILKECIIQNTSTPDIKYLEDGLKS